MDYLPKGRLDAFADGVFAIVITLLVLDLAVPEGTTNIISGLIQEWFVFLAYLISFAFIGSLWISHSSVTRLMKHETTHSYRLTLLMLFLSHSSRLPQSSWQRILDILPMCRI